MGLDFTINPLDKNFWTKNNWTEAGEYVGAAIDAATGQAMVDVEKQNLQYTKDFNKLQMERQDNEQQRHVKDLRAAGLSPAMAHGSKGASSGGLTAPQRGTQGLAQKQQFMLNALKAPQQIAMTLAELQSIEAQVANTWSQTRLNQARATEVGANVGLINSKAALSVAQESKTLAEAANTLQITDHDARRFKQELEMLTRQNTFEGRTFEQKVRQVVLETNRMSIDNFREKYAGEINKIASEIGEIDLRWKGYVDNFINNQWHTWDIDGKHNQFTQLPPEGLNYLSGMLMLEAQKHDLAVAGSWDQPVGSGVGIERGAVGLFNRAVKYLEEKTGLKLIGR